MSAQQRSDWLKTKRMGSACTHLSESTRNQQRTIMICELPWETLDPQKSCHQKISFVCITVPEDEHHFAETLFDKHTVFNANQFATRHIQKHTRLTRKSPCTAVVNESLLIACSTMTASRISLTRPKFTYRCKAVQHPRAPLLLSICLTGRGSQDVGQLVDFQAF